MAIAIWIICIEVNPGYPKQSFEEKLYRSSGKPRRSNTPLDIAEDARASTIRMRQADRQEGGDMSVVEGNGCTGLFQKKGIYHLKKTFS